jgi:hypothetical protein
VSLPSARPRLLALLLVIFVVTRLLVGVAAVASTGFYEKVSTDVNLYEQYGAAIVVDGQVPYGQVSVEYPPAVLPFISAPALVAEAPYRALWVLLMVAVDAVGLLAVYRLDRRWQGSGVWWWVVLIPLLGPLVYSRFDLIPAVATVWALERAAAARWAATGGLLALGALAKIWPALLVPTAAAVARRPRRLVLGGALVSAVVLLPFLPVWADLVRDVLGYHLARGIQVESLWANGLLLAAMAGYPIEVVREFGADHVASAISPLLKILSTALSLVAVAASAWWARRRLARDDARGLLALSFALVAVTVVTGSVLSPQYLVWLVALAAASQADLDSPTRLAAVLLIPTAVVNHALFPSLYREVVTLAPSGLAVLTLRNSLLVAVAVAALLGVLRAEISSTPAAAVPDRATAGAPARIGRR